MTQDSAISEDTPLGQRLKEQIRATGPVTVAEFMSQCLWDEHHGYYATRTAIGASGDFITAAEISQVFGEIIGLWAGVVWQQVLGAPSRLSLAEYGPGRGTMMRDMMRAARVVPGFANAAQIHLVELSAGLEATQRSTLAEFASPITWGHNLVGFATPAIVVANEFLDAWPLEQWVKADDGWHQRGIGLDPLGRLTFCLLDQTDPTGNLDRTHAGVPPGTIVETQRPSRLADAFQVLSRSGPIAALIIDYGYATASAGDTLQAVRGHAYEHPLARPGEADLSAHVSFYELATVMHGCGLEIDGPVTQAEFLGSLGVIERASRLMNANPARAAEIEAGLARLIAPNGMGTRFKVIGVRSPGLAPLPGFGAG